MLKKENGNNLKSLKKYSNKRKLGILFRAHEDRHVSKEDEKRFEERDMVANNDGRDIAPSTRSFHRNVVVSEDEEQERANTKPNWPKGESAERAKRLEERIFDTEEGEFYGDVGGEEEEREEEHADDEQWEGQEDEEGEAEKR